MAPDDEFSVATARAAAARGALRQWVADFLASPGSDNAPLAATLTERVTQWVGPVRVPIDRIQRLAGPPGDPVLCAVDDDDWDHRVTDMAARITAGGWQPAPVVVTFHDGDLGLEDGNHRIESLRQAGHTATWAVVGFESDADRAAFEATSPAPAEG